MLRQNTSRHYFIRPHVHRTHDESPSTATAHQRRADPLCKHGESSHHHVLPMLPEAAPDVELYTPCPLLPPLPDQLMSSHPLPPHPTSTSSTQHSTSHQAANDVPASICPHACLHKAPRSNWGSLGKPTPMHNSRPGLCHPQPHTVYPRRDHLQTIQCIVAHSPTVNLWLQQSDPCTSVVSRAATSSITRNRATHFTQNETARRPRACGPQALYRAPLPPRTCQPQDHRIIPCNSPFPATPHRTPCNSATCMRSEVLPQTYTICPLLSMLCTCTRGSRRGSAQRRQGPAIPAATTPTHSYHITLHELRAPSPTGD